MSMSEGDKGQGPPHLLGYVGLVEIRPFERMDVSVFEGGGDKRGRVGRFSVL